MPVHTSITEHVGQRLLGSHPHGVLDGITHCGGGACLERITQAAK